MKSTYIPSDQQAPSEDTPFERSAKRLADMIADDPEVTEQSHEYARNKCEANGIECPEETIDANEIYWAFVQEYTTNLVIVALGYNRTHIIGPSIR